MTGNPAVLVKVRNSTNLMVPKTKLIPEFGCWVLRHDFIYLIFSKAGSGKEQRMKPKASVIREPGH